MFRVARLQKTCPTCGLQFDILPSETYRKFCSNKCATLSGPHRKEKVVKTCINCGKAFSVPPYESDRKFCSKKCVSRTYLTPIVTKHCECCDQPFAVQPHNLEKKFCSRRCANGRNKRNEERHCVQCGAVFQVLRSSPQRFCSRECWQNSTVHAPRECPICHITFVPTTLQQRYCSQLCQGQCRVASITLICCHCGKNIEAWPSQLNRKKFCSRKCQSAHHSSQSEKQVVSIIASLLHETALPEYSFDWLISRSGFYLRLDAYFPRANIAVEYDGRQHREYTPFYHATPETFSNAQDRDKTKDELLALHGILLLRITDKEPITVEYISQRLAGMYH